MKIQWNTKEEGSTLLPILSSGYFFAMQNIQNLTILSTQNTLIQDILCPGWMHETSAGAGALGWPRGMGWGGRWEVGSGWGTHVNPWLIHVNVWQNPLQYCQVISLQLIKINGGRKRYTVSWLGHCHFLLTEFSAFSLPPSYTSLATQTPRCSFSECIIPLLKTLH